MLTKKTDILRREVKAHIEAAALVRGRYWRGGKGCFIGCLTHSSNLAPAIKRFGLPVEVLRLAEYIFERLPADDAKAFFAAFPSAVVCDGKDLSRVHWAFLAAELRMLPKEPVKVQAVIERVIAGMDALASGGKYLSAKKDADAAARDAADAADYAADYAARYAASAAAWTFDAAARAADYAAAAADYAAVAAVAAARRRKVADAARLDVICRQRDLLLRLIKEAPMGETK
jgi:hypothetical protein